MWDLVNEFTNGARDVTRKKSEQFIPIKVVPAHEKREVFEGLKEATQAVGEREGWEGEWL